MEREMLLKELDEIQDLESLEKIKLKLEFERIKVERFKARGTFLSIIIPLIIAALTIFYGVLMQNQQSKTNFQIKAAEIVMNATSPQAATNKAIVLSELFPDRLPKDFRAKMLSLYGPSDKRYIPK